VKRALRTHLRDMVALGAMVALGLGVAAYILSNQRLRFPLLEEKPVPMWVELPNAQGVTPGQGQTVRVSGMRIGDIGKVELHGGRARVRMDVEPGYADMVRRDASVLLRPRTGLKDMFLALDPGTRREPELGRDGVIPIDNSVPDLNADEILAALDTDTRAYLRLLINGAGQGLKGRDRDLREVFRRLGPLHRDLAALQGEVVKRRRNLSRLVNNYGSTVDRLGREDQDLATLVSGANRVFGRLSREDGNISEAVSRLPGTLAQTEATLKRVRVLGREAGPAFEALRPAVRQIDQTNRQLRPLGETAEPVLRKQVRPFVRAARPYVDQVRPAATNLAKASPDLRESFFELNRFFNMAAYNPGGRERLTGDAQKDAARDEGMLFWLGWVAHNSNLVFSTGDAQGPYRRIILNATCTTYRQILDQLGAAGPAAATIIGLQNLLADTDLCPPS